VDRIELLKQHLFEGLPPVWEEPFHVAWLAAEGQDLRVQQARAMAAEMAAARPFVKPGELLIGHNRLCPVVTMTASPFGNGLRLNHEWAQELRARGAEEAARVDGILAYWERWLAEHPRCRPMTCHASLAYERVVEWGLDGLGAYVAQWRERNVGQRPETAAWYEALGIVVEGMSAFVEAHAQAAQEAAAEAETTARAVELQAIADSCRHLAHGAPRSFREAAQLYYLIFLLAGHDSPGPVDRILWPALERELQAGTTTLAQAQEVVDCLWLKFEEKTAYGATVGGQARDGSDATTPLSLLCVEATRRLRLLSPRIAVRWFSGVSDELVDATCRSLAEGASLPALVNDEAMIKAAIARGTRLEDARDYTFVGCGQTYPHGRGHGNYEDVVINSAEALALVLHGGVNPASGRQEGPETGAPETLTTWEAFEAAYRAQMDALITRHIGWINAHRALIRGHAFDFIRSLLTWSCVERGLDWHDGGADYAEGMVDMVGLTTVTDSLAAIRRGVYEEALVSLPRLVKVLDADWEGEEALRACFLRRLPKFGNGDPAADDLMEAESHRINAHIQSHRTCFDGPWGLDIIGWSGAVEFGEHTAATPDGRRRGEALADCAGPAQGRNTQGLTTTLAAALRLPHGDSHGPLALSLRFPKEAVQGPEGVARLRAVVETYFGGGGQQLQVSVASRADMLAAQAHPEEYRSLMVRVGGFSAYFVQLDRRFQDDMIRRAELAV
jgi:pyruvate-formate lyase